ncbi:hypothetical protein OROHE_016800 [Orobanche hederae]
MTVDELQEASPIQYGGKSIIVTHRVICFHFQSSCSPLVGSNSNKERSSNLDKYWRKDPVPIDKYYSDGRYERITILTALGAYYSYLGKIEIKHREKDDYFVQATKYYNNASRIDMHEPSTWIGKGETLCFYWLFGAKGEVEQAFNAFNIVLDGDCDNVPALLGRGCVHFNRGRYSEALELYKRTLQVYPWAPSIRVGIALCHYKLGRFEKAKQVCYRVLQTRIMLKHLLHLEFRTCKTMKLEELIGVNSDVITAVLTAFIPQLVLIEASLKRLPSNTFIEFLKVITEKKHGFKLVIEKFFGPKKDVGPNGPKIEDDSKIEDGPKMYQPSL